MDGGVLPDGSLVVGTLSGNGDAFAELYRRHVGAVHRVVADRVHDREAAADLVQEVFARAIERLGDLREPDSFRPWLLAIARHAAIDRARERGEVPGLVEDSAAELTETDPEPEELAELGALAQRVRGCVTGLSVRDATVLSLIVEFGYSPTELGDALGISAGAAKVTVHRARRRLRSALALALLAERQDDACAAFRQAYEQGRLTEAGAHVAACGRCQAAVNSDVHLYGQDGSPRPTTRTSARSSTSASASGNGGSSARPNPVTSRSP